MKHLVYLPVFVLFLSLINCTDNDSTIALEVQSTDYDSKNIPVHVDIKLPSAFEDTPVDQIRVKMKSADGNFTDITGQVTKDDNGGHQLWWILPETQESGSTTWEATIMQKDENMSKFTWEDTPGKHMDLILDGNKVFRYEYELDSSRVKGETLTTRNRVFYHIYDLAGENFITNGPEEGIYSHHRGIMIGWRDLVYNDQELSFWGMEDLTTQKHIRFIKKTAGPVVSQVEALIHWNDSTNHTIIEENRTATIYHQPDPAILLLDFHSELTAVNGPVKLDGDAEHAGVQYRASNDIAAEEPGSKKPTYYFHQDNIDPKEDYNLPWVGMTYELNNKPYSVLHMDDSNNPEPKIWSAYRDYGRFGPYFTYELDDGETLDMNFRFWISESDMPEREKLFAKHRSYQNPPEVVVQ